MLFPRWLPAIVLQPVFHISVSSSSLLTSKFNLCLPQVSTLYEFFVKMKRNVNRVEHNEHIKLNLSVPAQPEYLNTEMMNSLGVGGAL